MPTKVDTARRVGRPGRASVPVGGVPDQWRPAGTDAALAVLDRIARYCVYTCEPVIERCVQEECEAWNLERTAAAYVAQRWVDGEG